jgi:hypothetical protein
MFLKFVRKNKLIILVFLAILVICTCSSSVNEGFEFKMSDTDNSYCDKNCMSEEGKYSTCTRFTRDGREIKLCNYTCDLNNKNCDPIKCNKCGLKQINL